MIFCFKLCQFPLHLNKFRFTFEQIPFYIQMWSIFTGFSHFTPKLVAHSCFIVLRLFSSFLYLRSYFNSFSKVCANRKFCLNPQIPLRFPVKTENHWLYMSKEGGRAVWHSHVNLIHYGYDDNLRIHNNYSHRNITRKRCTRPCRFFTYDSQSSVLPVEHEWKHLDTDILPKSRW